MGRSKEKQILFDEGLKLCTICKDNKSLTEFSICKGVYSSSCKNCKAKRNLQKYRSKHYSDAYLLRKGGKKKCNLCKEILLLEQFGHQKRLLKSGNMCNTWSSNCKNCIRVSKPAPKPTIKETKPPTVKPPKDKRYASNDQLYYEIVVSLELGRLTPKAQEILVLICKGAIKKFRYDDIQDREDCLSTAYLDVFSHWMNFNPYNNNVFSYITEICKRSYAKGWNQLKKRKGLEGYSKNVSLDTGNEGKGWYHSI